MAHTGSALILGLALSSFVAVVGCGDKDGDDTGPATSDGGTSDGGTSDGGTGDGGTGDGGTGDGGTGDGGTGDGGTGDGGAGDGGTGDGGTGDGGTGDGGTGDGGTGDGGTIDIETDCDDGIDDDLDGRIDCADPDCRRDPACAIEICDNKLDDDGDGDVDCDDEDCEDDRACAEPSECPEEDLGSSVGDAVAVGDNSAALDDFAGDCGGTGGLDVSFAWEVPEDGCYLIDTEDSDYDTVLRLYDECEGEELDCDDDGGETSLTSALQIEAVAGDSFVIVVDGYSSSSVGTYSLDINEYTVVARPDGDLGVELGDGVATGEMDGTEDRSLSPGCGSSTGLDYLFTWTAPSTDTFTFDTSDSDFDTVLSLHQTTGCYTELECDDDGGATSLTSQIDYPLAAGDEILIRVGSYSSTSVGSWVLDINIDDGGADTGDTGDIGGDSGGDGSTGGR